MRDGAPGSSTSRDPARRPAAYKVFSSGNTVAIFQFESRGMRDLIMKARPDRLEDLIALNALYRPGPMDFIPEFIDRKHGRSRWEYLDPRLKEILDPTYGVMTYQEHVMTIAQVIGGYTLGGADLCGRDGQEEGRGDGQQREIFSRARRGAGWTNQGERLFDQMEKFAGYGFNKSHSAAYAGGTRRLPQGAPRGGLLRGHLSAVMNDTTRCR